MTDQERWAHIVSGEAGGGWPEGSLLVAWTLRAWEVNLGMPAELAGRRWGWHGWGQITAESWQAVQSVWGQDPTSAPWPFMQQGLFCRSLGSANDLRWWASQGWYQYPPDFQIHHPTAPGYLMGCFFDKP